MNICVLYYDGFCEFEIVLSHLIFRNRIFSAALENRIYISEEKQKFIPDKIISDLNPNDIDLFIIPGGDPSHLFNNNVIRDFIEKLNLKNKYIAGICGGTELMAKFGILENKKCTGDSSGLVADSDYIHLFRNSIIKNEDVVVDGNIITSIGAAYIEFAIELGKIMNVFKTNDEEQTVFKWFKNIK